MKITFLLASGFSLSGGDRVISIYAERLRRRGHDVALVTRPNPRPRLRERLRSVRRGGSFWIGGHGPSHFDGLAVARRRIDRFRPIVASDLPDADVVVATWWETAEWAAALPPEKGAKAYFVQHYEAFENVPKDRVDATWRLPLQKITIASWLVDLARRRFGDDDVVLVPNSVDMDRFDAPPRSRQAVPTIGILNHVAPWKGVDTAIDAIGQARRRLPAIRLLSFGEHPFRRDVPAGIDHSHVTGPAQDEIRGLYASCDVWLSASKTEGFGLTCLEAMACRCPVVSTRSGGPSDFIRPGVNGYLAPVGDADALAGHLVSVLQAPEADWRNLSDAAHATASGYSWDDATLLFEAGLRRAIERQATNSSGAPG